MRHLAAGADVLVDDFRVGALDALGIGYEALAAINPRLIYCGISGRGSVKAGISLADVGAGMFGVIGVLLALQARHATGRGQGADTSPMEGQLAMLKPGFTQLIGVGTGKPGRIHRLAAPWSEAN